MAFFVIIPERYVHPAILFMGSYAVLSGRYTPFALVSLGYFLNLEKVLGFLRIAHHTLIFDLRFISLLFLTSLISGISHLYKLNGEN